ncbi:TetR/AcrR family transcriptional regulator [Rhodococcus sp. PD04]|uniref:TetR/AcrR family transcriptional regulator n=1 Tax=Rhodococcus sp. PD04 TaxID=3109594 RepID=UPI002DDB2D0F|nr:helix-turn-helix domain-containing protein [Rhodococcus sp. PD04]WSE23011.1 helix-turn-helix domain-containing protein [Rhodococcus sp. PD04]
MPPAPAARAKLLDAFVTILLEQGERAATLEAVAATAGVSKGGLLYHFPSKDALVEGLAEHVEALGAEDVERMRAAPEGPAACRSHRPGHRRPHPLSQATAAAALGSATGSHTVRRRHVGRDEHDAPRGRRRTLEGRTETDRPERLSSGRLCASVREKANTTSLESPTLWP